MNIYINQVKKYFTVFLGNKAVKSFYTYEQAKEFKVKLEDYQKGIYNNEVFHAVKGE